MNDKTILKITAIIALVILEIANLMTLGYDGTILSSIIGAIVFIATREYYMQKLKRYEEGQTT